MEQITIRIPDGTLETVDKRASESDESRSKVVRNLIELGLEHDELQSELEQREARIEELRRQLQERGEVEEKVTELVERTDNQQDALRETLEWSRAGIIQRTKWKLFGREQVEQPSTH